MRTTSPVCILQVTLAVPNFALQFGSVSCYLGAPGGARLDFFFLVTSTCIRRIMMA